MTESAAFVLASVIAGLCVLQIALGAGAPLGRFAWGGAHERLPAPLRVVSLVSLLVYGAWLVAGFLSLGVVMNALSRSKPERFTMTPVALVLAACAYVVAMS